MESNFPGIGIGLGGRAITWLWGLVPVWILTYPVFVAMHWSDAKRNLVVVSLGIVLACLGMYLAPLSLWI